MAKSDRELCARLAEWQGWRWVQVPSLCENRLVPPHEASTYLDEWIQKGRDPEWPDMDYSGPAYDTDPVAALELLGWLVEKGWMPSIHSRYGSTWVGVYQAGGRIAQHGGSVHGEAAGPPLVAVPAAIARAADKV